MADSIIGALRAILGIDTTAFTTGLKDSQKSLENFNTVFNDVAKRLAKIVIGAEIIASIKHAIDAADELEKASQKFGVPVEQLSALKFAAELADVSFEALGKGLKKLSQAMVSSLQKPTSDAATAFEALGISMEDIKNSTPDKILLKVADSFSRLEDGAGKTSIAVTLFGRAGADLVPLLNKGSDALLATTKEAEDLGIIIDSKTAAAAERFNDNMKALGKTTEALTTRLVADLAPAMADLTDTMKKSKIEGGGLKTAFEFIDEEAKSFIFNIKVLSLQISEMGKAWINFKAIFTAKSFEDMKKAGDDLDNNFRAIRDAVQTVSKAEEENARSTDISTEAFSAFEVGQQAALKANKALDAQFIANIDNIKNLTESLNKNILSAQVSARSYNLSAGEQQRAQIIAELFRKETELGIAEVNKQSLAIYILAGQLAYYTDKAKALGADKSLRESLESSKVGLEAEIETLGRSAGARQAEQQQRQLSLQIQRGQIQFEDAEAEPSRRREISQVGQLKDSLALLTDARNRGFEVAKLDAQSSLAIQAALDPSIAKTAQLKYVTEQLIAEQQKGNALTPELVAQINAVGAAQGTAAVATQAAQLIIGNRSPYDQLILQTQQHQEILKLYPGLYAQVAAAQAKTNAQMLQMQGQSVSSLLSGVSQVFMALGAQSKQAFETGKAFAIAAATVNSFLAFTKVLSIDPLPPPFNYIAAAATLASGLAQVIQIKNQKYTGAAMGGSFKVPGGSSSYDSRLIPMALAPGERVDVTPANKVGGGDGTLIINPIRPKDFFTGEMVREMVFNIDQWMRNGGTGVRFAKR